MIIRDGGRAIIRDGFRDATPGYRQNPIAEVYDLDAPGRDPQPTGDLSSRSVVDHRRPWNFASSQGGPEGGKPAGVVSCDTVRDDDDVMP